MSLPTLDSVQKLQTALHAKAKGAPETRFYTPYDKIYRKDVLWQAHRRCWLNQGVPGVDGQTFADIEEYGLTKWLCRKHKVPGHGTARFPDEYLFQTLGLVQLTCLPRRHPQRPRE